MLELLNRLAGKPIAECTNAEIYAALQALVKEKAQDRRFAKATAGSIIFPRNFCWAS